MAIKPDTLIGNADYDISRYVTAISGPSTTRMERGGVVCSTTGSSGPASGSAMDSALALVEYATNPSGRVAVGVLMGDFVNIDLSRQVVNWCKDEQQIGQKATLATRGTIVTNMIDPTSATGNIPATAYAGASGLFTQTNPGGFPAVGRFMSRKDSDGYAKIQFDMLANLS